MRAIAVLVIMLFHSGLSPYPGGFVMLDVFFVVSGFLITHLLLREASRDGWISLSSFYARRAKRILPAATVAAAGTVLLSAWLLNVVDARDAAVDSVWAVLFAANIRFATENTDYFAQDTPASPLQHFWSLSVEEQFYLALPAVLICCLWWAGRRATPTTWTRTRVITVTLSMITVLSFAWSVYASHASPATAYFSTFTRTWEFGVGALLAVAAPRLASGLSHAHRNLMAGTGLAAIAVACFVVTETTPFPGYAALLPVLGTGAVMLAGAEDNGSPAVMSRLLGVAPLRVVGDLSYSLYLWHWPILVIPAQHLGRTLTLAETSALLAASFAVSWASYRWVETPLRRARFRSVGRTLLLYPASVALVVVGSVAATTWLDRQLDFDAPAIALEDYSEGPSGEPLSKDRAVALVQASATAAQEDAGVPANLVPAVADLRNDKTSLGVCENEEPPFQRCRRGDTEADRTLVLLGDSHGRHWIPAMEKIAERAGYAAYYLVKSACTPADVLTVRPDTTQAWEDCTEFNAWMRRQVQELRPDLLVITGSGPPTVMLDGEPTSEANEVVAAVGSGFERTARTLSKHAGRTVVLGDTPRRGAQPTDCLAARDASLRDCLITPATQSARVASAMREAAAAADVDFIDSYQWFCAEDLCPLVVGSTITMRDRGHMTTPYARQLATSLGRALGLLRADGHDR